MKKLKLKYISTRLVTQKSKSAFQEGARKAMSTNGYVIIAHQGWVVKKYSNGDIERLEKLNVDTQNLEVILD